MWCDNVVAVVRLSSEGGVAPVLLDIRGVWGVCRCKELIALDLLLPRTVPSKLREGVGRLISLLLE